MQTPPRMLVLVLGLALLIGTASALQLNVTVTNKGCPSTSGRLIGTKVQVMVGNTTLYENITKIVDDRAMAQFTLAPGTYFLRLIRASYPDHVYLQTIKQDTELCRNMIMQKSTYTLFGRVTADPDYWAGREISLIDQKQDTVKSRATIMPDGYFLIDAVWPATDYYLRLDDGTQRIVSPVFQAPDTGAGYMEINGALAQANNTVLAPKLTASSKVALYSILSAQLKAGERPMVGQRVIVSTPRGTLNLSTDDNGQVYVQAAEGGDYTFTWETQVMTMSVPKPAAPAPPAQNNTAANGTPSTPIIPPEQAGAAATPTPNSMLVLGTASLALIAAIVVIAVVFIFFVVPRLMRMMSKGAGKKEEPAAPSWPAMPELPASLGGEEHAHKGHARPPAHHKHKHHRRKH